MLCVATYREDPSSHTTPLTLGKGAGAPAQTSRYGSWNSAGTRSEALRNPSGRENKALAESEMRATLVKLVFGGDRSRLEAFCAAVGDVLPPGTSAVLRGSSVTGVRWEDGSPFDADGPGTSDLDLTLVGGDLLGCYSPGGFYIPGIHSKPLSEKDPTSRPTWCRCGAASWRWCGGP